jgi:hypothetical protein
VTAPQLKDTMALPGVAATAVGAAGATVPVTVAGADWPPAFCAKIENVYCAPAVSPLNVTL